MDIRHAVHPEHAMALDTEDLRRHFHIDTLFVLAQITLTYSHIDRIIIGGICPLDIPLKFDDHLAQKVGTKFLLERREIGLINLGGVGEVIADGKAYQVGNQEAVYLGAGTKDVSFLSKNTKEPAVFYLACAPAHHSFPCRLIKLEDLVIESLGEPAMSNCRTIHKYFHPDVLPTCQLCMGLTRVASGSNWNTMPTHTHERRMEVYLYTEMDDDAVVFHFMGEPQETRHIIMRNNQAVISPSWSIHSGVGTKPYAFIWAMVGENQVFEDMDFVDMRDLR
jgi:4-deoxy-L-threo-5-hexosulose-uronate ketol-isomerase